jgi:hypothetical protein
MRLAFNFLLFVLAVFTSLLSALMVSFTLVSLNMPIALVIFAGTLVFPILPVWWVIHKEQTMSRQFGWRYRLPFVIQHISWKLLILNLLFIASLLSLSETNIGAQQPEPPASDRWPWYQVGLHPVVTQMPSEVEVSIESVAQYIASHESDPFQRIKALHDYVADRVAYDAPAFVSGEWANIPQDARTVFEIRKAVCQGYANLLAALGQAIGENIVVVTGKSRTSGTDRTGQGHAWNAIEINQEWYLLDATWDSGSVDGSTFIKRYRTAYLMPPPEVLIHDHFPDDMNFQLLSPPLNRSEFLQKPMLQPEFFAERLNLINPSHDQVNVNGTARIVLENPYRRSLLATYHSEGNSSKGDCGISPFLFISETTISCPLPHTGSYEVRLFSSSHPNNQHDYIGKLEFKNL